MEFFSVVEINADEQIVARVAFDLEDIDAAFEELEARYLAGEAAAHAHAWSVIAEAYAALNRGVSPETMQDCVHVDYRLRATIEGDDLDAYLHAAWDLTPDFAVYAEAVHYLSGRGAVVTHASRGKSPEGFDAEWQMIAVITVAGGMINRSEFFDEGDLDAALARFDELDGSAS